MEVIYKGNTLWYKNNRVEVGNSVIIKQFFELIEEDETIDIDSIEELDNITPIYDYFITINKILKWAKQTDKEIKSIKEYKEMKEKSDGKYKSN